MGEIQHKVIEINVQSYLKDLRKDERPQPRPQVQPVYGICGHIARSERHTCGSYNCTQQYGW